MLTDTARSAIITWWQKHDGYRYRSTHPRSCHSGARVKRASPESMLTADGHGFRTAARAASGMTGLDLRALTRYWARGCVAARRCSRGSDASGDACHAQIARRANWSQITALIPPANHRTSSRHPALAKRGASRSSRTLGAGCDGRFGRARRARCEADGEVVASQRRRFDVPAQAAASPMTGTSNRKRRWDFQIC